MCRSWWWLLVNRSLLQILLTLPFCLSQIYCAPKGLFVSRCFFLEVLNQLFMSLCPRRISHSLFLKGGLLQSLVASAIWMEHAMFYSMLSWKTEEEKLKSGGSQGNMMPGRLKMHVFHHPIETTHSQFGCRCSFEENTVLFAVLVCGIAHTRSCVLVVVLINHPVLGFRASRVRH